MKRALAAILVLAALAAPLSGCASIFDQEYLTIEDYAESTASPQQPEGTVAVQNYLELKLAINKLVTAHEERGSLDFSGLRRREHPRRPRLRLQRRQERDRPRRLRRGLHLL